MEKYPIIKQVKSYDCGPTCIMMICQYYKIPVNTNCIQELTKTDRRGTSIWNMCRTMKMLGLICVPINVTYDQFLTAFTLPCIAQTHIQNGKLHYVVIYCKDDIILVGDPAYGLIEFSHKQFAKIFNGNLILIS